MLSDGVSGNLEAVYDQYMTATEAILSAMQGVPAESRVSSMNKPPRMTRYKAMRKVYDAIHKTSLPQKYWFSCVNLSYDYEEENGELQIAELDATMRLLLKFSSDYFNGF